MGSLGRSLLGCGGDGSLAGHVRNFFHKSFGGAFALDRSCRSVPLAHDDGFRLRHYRVSGADLALAYLGTAFCSRALVGGGLELVFAAHSACESGLVNRCRVRDGARFEDSGRLGMDGTRICAGGKDASIRASSCQFSAVSEFASNDAA